MFANIILTDYSCRSFQPNNFTVDFAKALYRFIKPILQIVCTSVHAVDFMQLFDISLWLSIVRPAIQNTFSPMLAKHHPLDPQHHSYLRQCCHLVNRIATFLVAFWRHYDEAGRRTHRRGSRDGHRVGRSQFQVAQCSRPRPSVM